MEETAATAVSLPEDVVRDILLRVEETAALFRCAVTCKPWSRLVADASFLGHRWPDQDACNTSSTFLAGFLTWKQISLTESTILTSFVPTPPSVFGPSRRSLGSLFPDEACLLDNATPLTARRGLLLVRLDGTNSDDLDNSVVRLAVCNLLVGVCDVLPPLSADVDFDKSGHAILTSTDCSSSTDEQLSSSQGYLTFSKVVILGKMYHGRPANHYTFSASQGRWDMPRRLVFDTAKTAIGGLLRPPDAVVCGRTVHWLVGKSVHCSKLHTLEVDTETCRVSRTEIVAPANSFFCSRTYDEPKLRVAADGTLSLLVLQRSPLSLHVYMRQEGGKGGDSIATRGWISNGIVKLKPPEQIERSATEMHLSMLGVKGGTMLFRNSKSRMYAGDLETAAMNEVSANCFSKVSRERIVLLEMDWRTFFAYRLGRW